MSAFQSPSLRGSGRFQLEALARNRADAFQSPSLRGSGRFAGGGTDAGAADAGFNPLHCGAVVASFSRRLALSGSSAGFQSPSLRGSGRFRRRPTALARKRGHVSIPFIAGQWSLPLPYGGGGGASGDVSIPFIAGQWSLHLSDGKQRSGKPKFQSPSLRGSGRFGVKPAFLQLLSECFNPLHCGAVVASRRGRARRERKMEVSIPFIAGQWSLPTVPGNQATACRVSIPFIAGQWSLRAEAEARARKDAEVSIPFIAGQWSLQRRWTRPPTRRLGFQSPSLRGSGRFGPPAVWQGGGEGGFNPLHCGAVVASIWIGRGGPRPRPVSIPFIAGQWSLPPRDKSRGGGPRPFQSPSLRGSGRFH